MSPKEPLVICVSISVLPFFYEPVAVGRGEMVTHCALNGCWWTGGGFVSVLLKAGQCPRVTAHSHSEQICRSFFPLIQKG